LVSDNAGKGAKKSAKNAGNDDEIIVFEGKINSNIDRHLQTLLENVFLILTLFD
jgi:hypothetical protein